MSDKRKTILKYTGLFLISHAWWISFAFVATFCEGGIGSGYTCSIPIEGLAGFTEVSVLLLFPPFWPLIFYLYVVIKFLPKSWLTVLRWLLIIVSGSAYIYLLMRQVISG